MTALASVALSTLLTATPLAAGVPTVFVLRLKVVDRTITEIETIVMRNQMATESLDRIGRPRQTLLAAVPAAERLSRGELVRIGNLLLRHRAERQQG